MRPPKSAGEASPCGMCIGALIELAYTFQYSKLAPIWLLLTSTGIIMLPVIVWGQRNAND